MNRKIILFLFVFLSFFEILKVNADIIIPSKTYIYIESFGKKIEIPMQISYYDIGYSSFPWEEQKEPLENTRIDFWNFSYKTYGDVTYANIGGKYVISQEKHVTGKINDEIYFDQKIDRNFRKCESLEQFHMSTYDNEGEKYYVFEDQAGYEDCVSKAEIDIDMTQCEKKYGKPVDPKTFERDPDGNILENKCEVHLIIEESSWNNPEKAKELLFQGGNSEKKIDVKKTFFQNFLEGILSFFS